MFRLDIHISFLTRQLASVVHRGIAIAIHHIDGGTKCCIVITGCHDRTGHFIFRGSLDVQILASGHSGIFSHIHFCLGILGINPYRYGCYAGNAGSIRVLRVLHTHGRFYLAGGLGFHIGLSIGLQNAIYIDRSMAHIVFINQSAGEIVRIVGRPLFYLRAYREIGPIGRCTGSGDTQIAAHTFIACWYGRCSYFGLGTNGGRGFRFR